MDSKRNQKVPRQRARGAQGPRNQSNNGGVSVAAPVAMGNVRTMSKPRFQGLGQGGDVVIKHREYIQDISGTVAFTVNSFSINPGLVGTFPWLSGIAQRYESYRFKRLRFSFETESATTQTGSVLGSIDYDPSDEAPENKTQVMAYRSAVRSPPWSDFDMVSLQEDLSKRSSYFVRSGSLASNQDVKLYDTGVFYCCTQGNTASTIGELYVEYEVCLMTPQLGPPSAGESLFASYTGSSNAAPFGTAPRSGFPNNTLPATLVSTGTTTSVSTWTFTQPWSGYVALSLGGTGITEVTWSGTATEVEDSQLANAGATLMMDLGYVTADIGQTLVLTIANTTLTSTILYFGQGNVP